MEHSNSKIQSEENMLTQKSCKESGLILLSEMLLLQNMKFRDLCWMAG